MPLTDNLRSRHAGRHDQEVDCKPTNRPLKRDNLTDRPAHRPFRGLLSVHLRCGLHTRTVTVYRDRYPKASDTSSPPCLLRSLPAGAVAGWGLHPLEKRRLVTAHVDSRNLGERKTARVPYSRPVCRWGVGKGDAGAIFVPCLSLGGVR